MLGKITSGFTPVGNVRDMVADIIQGDWIDAGVNFAGILIDAADAAKTSGKIGKFLLNNADNSALYAEILSFVNKNFPDALSYLGKNEDFVKATKKISLKKEDKITKKQHDELKEIFDKMGLDDLIDGGSESDTESNVIIRIIDDISDKQLLIRANEQKEKLPSWAQEKKNFAYCEINIDHIDKTKYYAHSSISSEIASVKGTEISYDKENSPFTYMKVDGENIVDGESAWSRDVDAEYKILSDIQKRLGNNFWAHGKIILYTELEPCPSCKNVLNQFYQMYPNIKIEVIYSITK